jgi:hypothetical protein
LTKAKTVLIITEKAIMIIPNQNHIFAHIIYAAAKHLIMAWGVRLNVQYNWLASLNECGAAHALRELVNRRLQPRLKQPAVGVIALLKKELPPYFLPNPNNMTHFMGPIE